MLKIELHNRQANLSLCGVVTLRPGLNEVSEADWAKVTDHEITRWFLENKHIVVLEEAVADAAVVAVSTTAAQAVVVEGAPATEPVQDPAVTVIIDPDASERTRKGKRR